MLFKSEPRTKIATLLLIVVFSLFAAYVLMGCNRNKPTQAFKHSPSDTIMTLLVYKNNGIRWDMGYRIRKDSFMFFGVDSVTQKKNWTRYAEYFVPLIDSLRDKEGKALFDSTGKAKTQLKYYPCPANLIFGDMNLSLDSLSRANPPK
jgi:hypothetical protein